VFLGLVQWVMGRCPMVDRRDSGDLQLQRLGFGCVKLGSMSKSAGRSTTDRLIHEAVDSGVTFFDTADVYGSGTSERILGRALGAKRSSMIVMTKGGYTFRDRNKFERGARRLAAPVLGRLQASGRPATNPLGSGAAYAAQDFSPRYLRQAVDASLRRLRTDYIDIYQLHGPSSLCPWETVDLLTELVRAGKIREFGVGLERLDNATEWLKLETLSRMQVPFGMMDPEARTSVFPAAQTAGVQLIVRGVLASGLLNADASAVGTYFDQRKFNLLQSLRSLADSAGVTAEQLAIWWVLAQPAAQTVLVGINSVRHLRSTIRYVTTCVAEAALIGRVDELVEIYSSPGDAG
jgi:aryl-alcohol dehydrogenase-like predicted oxidoreductase